MPRRSLKATQRASADTLLSSVKDFEAAEQLRNTRFFSYSVGEGKLPPAFAFEGAASFRVPVILAPEQDKPLAAFAP
jgi:hypothetical protein